MTGKKFIFFNNDFDTKTQLRSLISCASEAIRFSQPSLIAF